MQLDRFILARLVRFCRFHPRRDGLLHCSVGKRNAIWSRSEVRARLTTTRRAPTCTQPPASRASRRLTRSPPYTPSTAATPRASRETRWLNHPDPDAPATSATALASRETQYLAHPRPDARTTRATPLATPPASRETRRFAHPPPDASTHHSCHPWPTAQCVGPPPPAHRHSAIARAHQTAHDASMLKHWRNGQQRTSMQVFV